MVFAPASDLGTAKVVPCKVGCSDINGLCAEAEALWLAESPDGVERKPTERLAANWGAVGLIVNPRSKIPGSLLADWAKRVATERFHKDGTPSYQNSFYTVNGMPSLNSEGIMQIEWPAAVGSNALDGIDLLLATATQPTLDQSTGDFASAEAIAEAWNTTKDANYFHKNREHGFHTFQDDEIRKRLHV